MPKDGRASGGDAAPETQPPVESSALIELRRRLRMLTMGRIALVTVLLAATALIEWQARIQTSASAATEGHPAIAFARAMCLRGRRHGRGTQSTSVGKAACGPCTYATWAGGPPPSRRCAWGPVAPTAHQVMIQRGRSTINRWGLCRIHPCARGSPYDGHRLWPPSA